MAVGIGVVEVSGVGSALVAWNNVAVGLRVPTVGSIVELGNNADVKVQSIGSVDVDTVANSKKVPGLGSVAVPTEPSTKKVPAFGGVVMSR